MEKFASDDGKKSAFVTASKMQERDLVSSEVGRFKRSALSFAI